MKKMVSALFFYFSLKIPKIKNRADPIFLTSRKEIDIDSENNIIKSMQKTTTYPKTELTKLLPPMKTSQEILEIWERARGIWKKKKLDPIKYLEKTRKEWEGPL